VISSPGIRTAAELRRVMGTDYEVSPQQWAAISAPLEPAVVIAGAGSGKTSLMAARVVFLVVTGEVLPDQVLGLTFTTKAAGELRGRIRAALDAAGFARGALTMPLRTARRRSWSRWWRRTTPTPPPCSPSTACALATNRTRG